MLRWEGAPGQMTLLRLRGVRVSLTRWNNLAPRKTFRRYGKGQVVLPLRRFKVGRKSLYLKVSWGY
jgi:hypothetical protein